jgi:hypothetical protein
MGRIRNSGFRDSTDDVDRLEPERIVLDGFDRIRIEELP